MAKAGSHAKFVLSAQILCGLIFILFAKAERVPVKTYTTADGLPRDNASHIGRDSRGFLWFCTAEAFRVSTAWR